MSQTKTRIDHTFENEWKNDINDAGLFEQNILGPAAWRRWLSDHGYDPGAVSYGDYQSTWNDWNQYEADDAEYDGDSGYEYHGGSINIEAAENTLETFFKNVPGLKDYLGWYYDEAKDTILRQRSPYPFDITIDTPEGEQFVLDTLRSRLELGSGLTEPPAGLSEAYEGAYKKRLPALQRQQDEQMAEAQESLDKMGLSGSLPGLTATNELQDRFAIEKELLGFESDIGLAQAKEADWQRQYNYELQNRNLQSQDLSTYFTALARPEERERRNIEAKIAEESNIRGLPAMVSLGQPTAASGLSAAAGVYNQGVQSATSLGVAGIGANAQTSIAGMNNQFAWQQMLAEQNYMQPYLQQSLTPIESPDTGWCIIATVCSGSRESYWVKLSRRYRDSAMSPKVLRGYYILADWLVPKMLKSKMLLGMVKWQIVARLMDYLEALFGIRKRARASSIAMAKLFEFVCYVLGDNRKTYVRSNGEIY